MRTAFDELWEELREESLAAGRAEGRAEGEARGEVRGEARSLANLMKSTHWGLEQAMMALGLPLEQRERYVELLGQLNP